jgi:outer membrane protein assembly factor BamB
MTARAALLLALLAVSLPAADWPQFLGPTRDGRAAAAETALPTSFAREPEVLWRRSAGSGFAGPVVADGKVILFHREGGDMTTEALDPRTGKTLWRSVYVTDYVDSFGFDNGPRAVPAVAEGRVFTHGPEGRVTALDLATGRELWAFDTAAKADSPQGFFGRAPSPLVLGERVWIAAGGELDGRDAGLLALDVRTGAPVATAAGDEAGYASPVAAGPERVLAWMRNRLWLVEATTGAVLDSRPLRSTMDASVNAASPLACGEGRWFVSAGYGVGANLFQITDKPALEEVWSRQEVLDCHYATPVLHEGHLYGFHGRQETGMKLRCVRLVDGEVVWEAPDKLPGGTLQLVGDRLLVVTEQGELWVVPASPKEFDKALAVQILRAGHRSHAAYADGVLFARDSEELVAVPLR